MGCVDNPCICDGVFTAVRRYCLPVSVKPSSRSLRLSSAGSPSHFPQCFAASRLPASCRAMGAWDGECWTIEGGVTVSRYTGEDEWIGGGGEPLHPSQPLPDCQEGTSVQGERERGDGRGCGKKSTFQRGGDLGLNVDGGGRDDRVEGGGGAGGRMI